MNMASTTISQHNTLLNGHTVPLFNQHDSNFPVSAAQTDWILVRFDRFVTYPIKEDFHQNHQLEIYERLDDDNVYLCKYVPDDLQPIINDDKTTHVALFPASAVPVAGLDSSLGHPEASDVSSSSTLTKSSTAGDAEDNKVALVVALQPRPHQSPQQVLHELETRFGAEHLDSEIDTSVNLVRVRLDATHIPAVAGIDSVRTISVVVPVEPFSIITDDVLGTNPLTTRFPWTGLDETVHVADTGFDKGSNTDVHPAFSGRVLAATTSQGATYAFDQAGHGTHVAGSVLGDLSQSAGTDMTDMKGTAPQASLVSLALDFNKMPPLLNLFTQVVGTLPPPILHTNSWGPSSTTHKLQYPYNAGDAQLVDQAMSDHHELCVLFAAGNDGTVITQNGRQQQVSSYASAKNNITVGACYSTRPVDKAGRYDVGGQSHAAQEMTTFSSRGPTLENRLGIDVVAPGQVVLSARSRSIDPAELTVYLADFGQPSMSNLLFSSGTSMSTPAVTGCVACLRQAYRQTYQTSPSGAMLKALIVHGAVDLKGTIFTNKTPAGSSQLIMTAVPNTFQGYGMVNIKNSLRPIAVGSTVAGVKDGAVASGITTVASPKLPSGLTKLVATLAYTDIAAAALQNVIKLSIKAQASGVVYQPLQPNDPLAQTPPMVFTQSNVAKVVVDHPAAGTYDIVLEVQSGNASAPYAVVWSAW